MSVCKTSVKTSTFTVYPLKYGKKAKKRKKNPEYLNVLLDIPIQNYSISLHRYCYWDLSHFTTMEAAWAEPCSCTETDWNLHKETLKSVVTYYQEIVCQTINDGKLQCGRSVLLTAQLAWDHFLNFLRFLDNIQNKWPVLNFGALCCFNFYDVLYLTILFFFCFPPPPCTRDWRNPMIKAVLWKFNVMLLILFLWREECLQV